MNRDVPFVLITIFQELWTRFLQGLMRRRSNLLKQILVCLLVCWAVFSLFLWDYNVQNTHQDLLALQDKLRLIESNNQFFSAELENQKAQWRKQEEELGPLYSKFVKYKEQVLAKEGHNISISFIVAVEHNSDVFDLLSGLESLMSKMKARCEVILVRQSGKQLTTNANTLELIFGNLFSVAQIIDVPVSTKNIYNWAAKAANGKYLVFLSACASLFESGLSSPIFSFMQFEAMLQTMETNANIGIIGSTTAYQISESSDFFLHSGGIHAMVSTTPSLVAKLYTKFKGVNLLDERIPSHSMIHLGKVDTDFRSDEEDTFVGVSRMGMMIPKSLFELCGRFDDLYLKNNSAEELFYQDVDLCLKVKKQGLDVVISNNLVVVPRPQSVEYLEAKDSKKRKDTTENEGPLASLFASQWKSVLQKMVVVPELNLNVMWDLYCGCTGLNIEAINFLVPLEGRVPLSVVAGEDCFCKGFAESVHESLERIRTTKLKSIDVFISHKPANKYPTFPYTGIVKIPERPSYVIGRSMTESTPIPADWIKNCNQTVDEIWVPTNFHIDVFKSSGIKAEKLFRIPEATDVHLWNPVITEPLAINSKRSGDFNFLSVFKWEPRKGWDVLLQAYFEEFLAHEPVTLYLHTYLYGDSNPHNEEKIRDKVKSFATDKLKLNWQALPRVEILSKELPSRDMPRLYANFDAFVLSTRGEGWGLPIVEAMAMEIPCIATNWSGPTDFLTTSNSYPLRIDGLSAVKKGSEEQWANPSLAHLKQLMRHVFTNRAEAKEKGRRARQDVIQQYSQEKVSDIVMERLRQIESKLKKASSAEGG